MRKTIVLNCLPLTKKKEDTLDSLFSEYLRVLNLTLEQLPNAKSSNELHHRTYSNVRGTSFLLADIIQEARKDVWAKRKTVKSGFQRCSIRFNRRLFKFFETERGTPCFRITYAPHRRLVLPIRKDGGFERFKSFIEDGWAIKGISLLDGKIAVSIEKAYPEPNNAQGYVVGVDIGSATLATVTVLDTKTGKTVKQLYLGRDVAIGQRKYLERREKLQSHADRGSRKAKKYLKRMKRKQRNFVKTRSGQVAKEIVNIAKEYDASIAIENLRIGGRKHKFNKEANRKINWIPYAQFREFLISDCEEASIPLDIIDAYHTSKWCPHCGSVNRGHSSVNYALYVCERCGMVVNSDRKASKAIAIKSALERELSQGLTNLFSQFSSAGVAVNQLFRPRDEVISGAVHHTQPRMESQRLKSLVVYIRRFVVISFVYLDDAVAYRAYPYVCHRFRLVVLSFCHPLIPSSSCSLFSFSDFQFLCH